MISTCKCNEDSYIDILEQDIANLDISLLKKLLKDKTTGKNIIWACDEYQKYGPKYAPGCEITANLIIGKNTKIIRPRIAKTKSEQINRTRNKAEVFTPAWLCNEMNNQCDAIWFERDNVFNRPNGHSWTVNNEKIIFDNPKKTWQNYVDLKFLEITCGEAPYLVSRYDTTTGKYLPVGRRIGVLDRKLRIISENTDTEEDWWKWVQRAFQSTYGYEYQGDNLLLARENLLWTFQDYYKCKFNKDVPLKYLKTIVNIIVWNVWQMDGLTDCPPKGVPYTELYLFECYQPQDTALPCKIQDWRCGKPVLFKDLKGAAK